MPITVTQTAVSNAERRALLAGEPRVIPRVADVYAALPGSRVHGIEFAPDASPDLRNYRVSCERIARELNIDLKQVRGSGTGGAGRAPGRAGRRRSAGRRAAPPG